MFSKDISIAIFYGVEIPEDKYKTYIVNKFKIPEAEYEEDEVEFWNKYHSTKVEELEVYVHSYKDQDWRYFLVCGKTYEIYRKTNDDPFYSTNDGVFSLPLYSMMDEKRFQNACNKLNINSLIASHCLTYHEQ